LKKLLPAKTERFLGIPPKKDYPPITDPVGLRRWLVSLKAESQDNYLVFARWATLGVFHASEVDLLFWVIFALTAAAGGLSSIDFVYPISFLMLTLIIFLLSFRQHRLSDNDLVKNRERLLELFRLDTQQRKLVMESD